MIDYLKLDVEESEWSALEAMFTEGVISRQIKQIGIEYHISVFKSNPERYARIMATLKDLGFLKWNVNWNMHCITEYMSSCIEVYYININFLKAM